MLPERTTTPVAQRLWPDTRKFRAAVNHPVAMRTSPMNVPITTRIAGVIRLLSNEYLTRNTIPRKRTKPPIHAKSFTPKNASQSNGLDGTGGGGGMGGGGGGSGVTGLDGGGGGIGGGGGSEIGVDRGVSSEVVGEEDTLGVRGKGARARTDSPSARTP